MISTCALISIESNSQIQKKKLTKIQRRKPDSIKKINLEEKTLAEKRKKDSLELVIHRNYKYCSGCGMG